MEFFNRGKELNELLQIQKQSLTSAQMTVIRGRKRIGKTELLRRATEGQTTLYFFVSRKVEPFLCQDLREEVANKLGVEIIGEINNFSSFFEYLMILSKDRPFNLIIDEIQEFMHINPHVFFSIQKYWNKHKDKSRINILITGSADNLMTNIFENSKEPMFECPTNRIELQPFTTGVIKEILAKYHPQYTPEDLLSFYSITGGMPEYMRIFIDNKAFNLKDMLNLMIKTNSSFLTEGMTVLNGEFGKDYSAYFTIMSAIASGECSRVKIEEITKKDISGYLTKLEFAYKLVKKDTPIFSNPETKKARYLLEDNFLTFWFRYIYKYSYLIEIGEYEKLKQIILDDYHAYSSRMLELYFRAQITENGGFNRLDGFWNRKGVTNIDLVASNGYKKTIEFIDIDRDAQNLDLERLKEIGQDFLKITKKYKKYFISYRLLSMEDM